MFKTDVHLVSFILNGMAVLFGYSTGTCATGSAEETALCPYWTRSEKFPSCPCPIPFWTFVFQASTSLTSLMLYHNSADIQWCLHNRGIGDLSLSLRDCPCPCWTGAIYRCIYVIFFQDGISLTRAHLEKYSLAHADRYRTTDACTTRRLPPCWTAGVREMLPCPILLNVSRSGRHFSQYW